MKILLQKKYSVLSFVLITIFVILQVTVLNYDSTNGRQFEKLSNELKELEMSNSLLEKKVASASSIIAISEKAKILGFDSKKTIVSLYSPQPLAAIQNTL